MYIELMSCKPTVTTILNSNSLFGPYPTYALAGGGLLSYNVGLQWSNRQIDAKKPMKRHIRWLYFEIEIFRQFWRP